MLRIVIEVDAPPYLDHAVKEDIAMYMERHGDCRVVSVEEVAKRHDQFVQTRIAEQRGGKSGKQQMPRMRR